MKKGARCILAARCSTEEQVEDSIPQQIDLLQRYARENDLMVTDVIESGNVSATTLGERKDLADLFDRAARREFDVLVLQSYDRLTRRGPEHGAEIVSKFNSLGVQVIATEDKIDDDDEWGWLKRGLRFQDARAYAVNLSFSTSRGTMAHIVAGELPHSNKTPYGLDRLYTLLDGKPVHKIRNLPDGRRAKLDPNTHEVLSYFERDDSGKTTRYTKQANEIATYVPGASETTAAVRHMFRRKFVDLVGYGKIARELNNKGIPAVLGGSWNTASINHILENSVYLGWGLTNRFGTGTIHMRDVNGPKKMPKNRVPQRKKWHPNKMRKTLVPVARPESDWYWVGYPHLKNFLKLSESVLAEIQKWQIERAKARSKAIALIPNRDRHSESAYFLKGLLKTKDGNASMSGHSCSPRGEKCRYYRVKSSMRNPSDLNPYKKGCNAEVIEKAVLDVLDSVLTENENLGAEVDLAIRQALKKDEASGSELDALLEQQKQLQGTLDLILNTLSAVGQEVAKRRLTDLDQKLSAVQQRITAVQASQSIQPDDVEKVIGSVTRELADIGATLRKKSPEGLRQVVNALISNLTVDLETKEVEMELSLPSWALSPTSRVLDPVCLESRSSLSSKHQTNGENTLILAKFICSHHREHWRGCLSCSRTSALKQAA